MASVQNTTTQYQVRRRKQRTLEGNEDIVNKLNLLIDKLYKYSYAWRLLSKLRQDLNGQSCLVKNYYGKNNGSKFLLNIDTPLGELVLKSEYSITAPNSLVKDALDELNIDIDMEDIINNFETKYSFGITVDTKILKVSDEVNEKVTEEIKKIKLYEQLYEENINEYDFNEYNNEEKEIIKYCIVRKKLYEELLPDSKKYRKYYSIFKDSFIKAKEKRNFPRKYEYKGVMIYYQNSINLNFSLQRQIYELYNKDNPELYDMIERKIKDIIVRNNRSTIKVILIDNDDDEYEDYIYGTLL